VTRKARPGNATGTFLLKRAYDPPAPPDGSRFLVERLWPRGVRKDELRLEAWLKDVAPTADLRRWFGHDPEKWPEFKRRYFRQLHANERALAPLREAARHGTVTLVYGARDTEHNAALALREYLERIHGRDDRN
jgi:uncharacterized protein YeaO (DUF488 family)